MPLGQVSLSVADARDLAEGALRGIGYHDDEARIIADHVIDAALCGYEYSGLAKILNIPESEHFKQQRRPMKVLRERLGELLPEGVAIGPDGGPTRDPALARRGGALLPFGGYKGFGLALMVQALGVLAESGSEHESDYGYLFIAFEPELVGPADVFKRRVTQLIERTKAIPRQPGVDEIRLPSERAFRFRERALREGLEIDRLVFDALVTLRAGTA